MSKIDVDRVGGILLDARVPLKARFRALFILRNVGGESAIDYIGRCLRRPDEGALLKHELAYVLGQLADAYAVDMLIATLDDTNEAPMTRHEAGERMFRIFNQHNLQAKRSARSPTPAHWTRCAVTRRTRRPKWPRRVNWHWRASRL